MNSQRQCARCQSKALMPSGICLDGNLPNPPPVDKAKEAAERHACEAEAQHQQKEQLRQQVLQHIARAIELAQEGDDRWPKA